MNTHACADTRRAENLRDNDGRLLPAPSTLLNPMRLSEKAKRLTGQAAFDARYDALMDQVRDKGGRTRGQGDGEGDDLGGRQGEAR